MSTELDFLTDAAVNCHSITASQRSNFTNSQTSVNRQCERESNLQQHRPSGICRVVSVGAWRAGRFEDRPAGDRAPPASCRLPSLSPRSFSERFGAGARPVHPILRRKGPAFHHCRSLVAHTPNCAVTVFGHEQRAILGVTPNVPPVYVHAREL